ncbi:MAG: MazG family protein [Pseudonocardia sp.]
MSDTVVLLSTRLGAVLPAEALPALRGADEVLADGSVPAELASLAGASVIAQLSPPTEAARVLLTTDPAVAAGAEHVITTPEPSGAAVLDAVAVMDTLRSPGGCPWDAEQTHTSLLPYLIEEAYELYGAVEDGDRTALREELGDVLLQVLFHARLAQEPADAPFTIDEVAADLVEKLVARHPHVFADAEKITTAADQQHRWEELKRVEKRRQSSVDGVPLSQPSAALAAKLVSRARRAGWPPELLTDAAGPAAGSAGERLFALVAELKLAGVEPEGELRAAAHRYAAAVRATEQAARTAGEDSSQLSPEQWRRYWPGQA